MGGTDFSKNYTHRGWHLYPLEGSGGMLPREIVKIRASILFVLGTLNGGGGGGDGCAPLWIRHCPPPSSVMGTSTYTCNMNKRSPTSRYQALNDMHF